METLIHPYEELRDGAWLRVNLHAHTTQSDGLLDIEHAVRQYSEQSYDGLMISDHDVFTGMISREDVAGSEIVRIPGNEISRNGTHLLHVGAKHAVNPQPDRQAVIAEINATSGFAVVCHPNWKSDHNYCGIEQLLAWRGYTGIEIFNGAVGWMKGDPYALQKWDMLLSRGRRVWGFANDDSHAEREVGVGWNMVYSADRSPAGILSAMKAGRFYASTGVGIDEISVDGRKVRIVAGDAGRIICITRNNCRFAISDSGVLDVEVPESFPYVRFECWGSGERFAWTQPFWTSPEPDAGADL